MNPGTGPAGGAGEAGAWLTKAESAVLGLFRKDPSANYTINEIASAIGTGSYAWTYNAIKRLERAGIVSTEQRGNLRLIRANLSSPLTVEYLSLLDLREAQKARAPGAPMPESVGGEYFTLLKVGTGFILVVPDSESPVKFSGLKARVLKASEFIVLLRGPEGRGIAEKRMIFHGAAAYYSMLREAMGSWAGGRK